MTHLTDQQLLALIEQPTAEHLQAERVHLAQCAECRKRHQRFAQLQQQLSERFVSVQVDDEDWFDLARIDRFLAGQLSAPEHDQFQQDLTMRPNLLRAALHQARHTESVEAVANSTSTARENSNRPSVWQVFKDQFRWPTLALGASMAAVAMAVIVVWPQWSASTGVVQPLAQGEQLTWGEAQPGMGFFQGVNQWSESFAGVEVTADSKALTFKWPPVADALSYQLRLLSVEGTRLVEVAREQSTETTIAIDIAPLARQRYYEWTLTGQVPSGQQFQTQGGFVLKGAN